MGEPKNKIIFSERIDSIINGLTLGISFVLIGLFLLFVPNYFGNQTVGEIIRWIFIAVGILGLIVEFNKLKSVSKIEGLRELWTGIFLLSSWAALFFLVKNIIGNIGGFFCLVFGAYGFMLGLFRVVYSFYINAKSKTESKGNVTSDAIILLTKIASLVLVVIQIVKALQGV